MRKILVCQHVAHEILGTLNPLFKKSGFRIKYVNFDRYPNAQPGIEGYNGLVILGGPMGVYDGDTYPYLDYEVQLIQEALKKDIPILGICLGAQLIAKALGATVKKNKEKEIGWYKVHVHSEGKQDSVMKYFNGSEQVFHWHGDIFDIPQGAVHLASSELCPNQAFRYGNKVYGFQFHLEVDEPMIERWLKVPGMKKQVQELSNMTSEQLIKDTQKNIRRLKQLSDLTFGEFIKLFGEKKMVTRLCSR